MAPPKKRSLGRSSLSGNGALKKSLHMPKATPHLQKYRLTCITIKETFINVYFCCTYFLTRTCFSKSALNSIDHFQGRSQGRRYRGSWGTCADLNRNYRSFFILKNILGSKRGDVKIWWRFNKPGTFEMRKYASFAEMNMILMTITKLWSDLNQVTEFLISFHVFCFLLV